MSKPRHTHAAKLERELAENPLYDVDAAARTRKINEWGKALSKDEAPLVKELQEAGYDVKSVWDFDPAAQKYKSAIPVLIRHLNMNYEERNVEGIALALRTRDARGLAADALFERLEKKNSDHGLFTIGDALSVVATKKDLPRLHAVLENPRYGAARDLIVHAIVRLERQAAIPVLMKFLDDNDPILAIQCVNLLGNLRALEARSGIEKFLHSDDGEVRQKAKAALKKIDKAAGIHPPGSSLH